MGFLKRMLGGSGFDEAELARRLGVELEGLAQVPVEYDTFSVAKRGGGRRTIHAPRPPLKDMQRRIHRRLLALLVAHPAAHGFETGRSIVTNASAHASKAVVARIDLENFFPSTGNKRLEKMFRRLGWNKAATRRLIALTTRDGGLPQGAPSSPRLSNLVNVGMDTRLDRFARRVGATYTRYADDLVFSFADDRPKAVRQMLRTAEQIVEDCGYRVHRRKKRSVRRRHQHQRVTGLVVNDQVNLPRETRRRLRAAAHNLARGRGAQLSASQLAGWDALQEMIEKQR